MINSVSNMGNFTPMTQSSGMKEPPPPKDKDVFQVADTDGDGVVSQAELEVLAEGIKETTGNTINVDEALSSYDANQDGGLSGEELLAMMTSQGFSPPPMAGGEEGESGTKPPPPPVEQALSAYEQNSSDDPITQLLELLQSKESDETYFSTNITA